MNIVYEWNFGGFAYADDSLITECSELYSEHYGKWSEQAPDRKARNIKLSPARLKVWLDDENSAIYLARDGGKLVGYAIALRIEVPSYGIVSWVTQLVVHKDYRNIDIAKNLLLSVWGFSDDFAWGIISANPYAVRALEKATRRRSDPLRIKQNIREIVSIGLERVPYISKSIESIVADEASRINTQFYVDHSEIEAMIRNITTESVPWKLGKLEEGWEWLAFTFQDQPPIKLTNTEIAKMLEASDRVVHMAYARMEISDNHLWARHTEDEVKFILEECSLHQGDAIIDFGCGTGRHALKLAQNGIYVQAIDYVGKHIECAQKRQQELDITNVSFVEGDCRTYEAIKSKAVICLYDAIGSYADNDENIRILQNISDHIEIVGVAILSVMNYELTLCQAVNCFTFQEDPSRLLTLNPSNTMESTGDIFNPDCYLVDTADHVVYRREQFKRGNSLPI